MINACNFVFCKKIDKSMRLGIVTPFLNGEKFLYQIILSVVSQARKRAPDFGCPSNW